MIHTDENLPDEAQAVHARHWLAEHGLPHAGLEHWRMTPVARLQQESFALHHQPDFTNLKGGVETAVADYRAGFSGLEFRLVVFVDGFLVETLSDSGLGLEPDGAPFESLDYARLPFAAQNIGWNVAPRWNLALKGDNTTPVHLLWLHTVGGASFAQATLHLAPESTAQVVESHVSLAGADPAFSNSLMQVVVGKGARLAHYKWQNLAENHVHIAASLTEVAASATLDGFVLNVGGGLVRQDTEVLITGSHATAIINGAYIGRGRQHIDNTSQIRHLAPDSYSREVYKGVLSDESRGVFQARILVDQVAQRTDAYQMNRALLLSNLAEVRSKPELEIYADDVKCSHGATVGQLDADQMFYLRSRGLSESEASVMLIDASLEEVFVDMTAPEVGERLGGFARDKLHRMAGQTG